MKIKEVVAVKVKLVKKAGFKSERKPSWNDTAARALPVNTIEGLGPAPQTRIPGATGEAVWVKVTAEDGSWGLGRCSYGEPVAMLVDRHFAPLLVGRDCFATELLNDIMSRSSMRHGVSGLSAIAQSGIDLALWDLKGKLLGEPVYRLLGGPSKTRVRCYATCDDIEWAQELGFTGFKISNPVTYIQGREGLDILEEKVGKARDLVGQRADLMLNPIMSFNVNYTVQLAERLRPFDLTWLEEPLPVDNLEGYIELRKRVPWLAFATGEDHHMRWTFRQLIEHRCVDVLQPDLQWCGGLSEAVKIYTLGEAAGIVTSPHVAGNSPYGQHFVFALPGCDLMEYHISSPVGVPLDEAKLIPGMPTPVDGYLTPSDSPGFGINIDANSIIPWF